MSAPPTWRLTEGADPPDPFTLEPGTGSFRDEPTEDERRAALAGPTNGLVHLIGYRLADHTGLPAIVQQLRGLGRTAAVVACPTPADLPKLAAAAVLILPLHGPRDVHDALTGRPSAWDAALAALATRRVRVVARLRTPADAHAVVAAVRDRAEQLHLVPHPDGTDAATLDAVLEQLRGSATSLHLDGLHVPPDVVRGPPRPREPHVLDLRLQGGWVPGLGGGVRPKGRAQLLHPLGLSEPPFQAPLTLSDPIAIVTPGLPDVLLATSTLPGLAAALAARGRDVALRSVWHAPWNLYGPPPDAPPQTLSPALPGALTRRLQTARQLQRAFLDRLDLRDSATIIAPGWDVAWRLLHHPTRRPDSQLVVIDLHLQHGVEPWRDLPADAWAQVWVLSCFPGFVAAYLRAGVPLDRIRWIPYPVDTADLPPAPSPLPDDAPWVAAGSHARDPAALLAAGDGLRDRRRIRVHGPLTPTHPALDPAGVVGLDALCRSLRDARAVLVLARSSADDPAGISVAALALAAGRPVVATASWGLRDHVQHGVSGLLLPPGDGPALAAAVARLDADDDALAALAAGARDAAARADVTAVADLLLDRPLPAWPPALLG